MFGKQVELRRTPGGRFLVPTTNSQKRKITLLLPRDTLEEVVEKFGATAIHAFDLWATHGEVGQGKLEPELYRMFNEISAQGERWFSKSEDILRHINHQYKAEGEEAWKLFEDLLLAFQVNTSAHVQRERDALTGEELLIIERKHGGIKADRSFHPFSPLEDSMSEEDAYFGLSRAYIRPASIKRLEGIQPDFAIFNGDFVLRFANTYMWSSQDWAE